MTTPGPGIYISNNIYFQINTNNIDSICKKVDQSSSISFNYNGDIYEPIAYQFFPNFINETYQPPPNEYAYYDLEPLNATISILIPQTSPLNMVYQVEYSFYSNELLGKEDHIYDLFYINNNIAPVFSSDFQNSGEFKSNLQVFKNFLISFCENTGEMNSSLCSSEVLPFIMLDISKSPCLDPYSSCSKGWNKYCFTDMNYDTNECISYYSDKSSYEGNQLNSVVKENLQEICGSLHDSNLTQSESYWKVCSCFLPDNVYSEFLEQNNVTGLPVGSQQCWYYPCFQSDVLPEQAPNCSNNTVTSCIQKSYIDLADMDGDISDNNLKTNQTIQKCAGTSSSNNNSGNSAPSTSTTPPVSSTSSTNTTPPVSNTSSSGNIPQTENVPSLPSVSNTTSTTPKTKNNIKSIFVKISDFWKNLSTTDKMLIYTIVPSIIIILAVVTPIVINFHRKRRLKK